MDAKRKYVPWLILFGLVLTWGSSFILIKQGLKGFDYDSGIVGALRIVITFLVLLPIALSRIKRIKKKQWLILAVVGITGNLGPAFFFAYAQTGIDSNTAGILNSLTPLFTLLIGLLFFQLKPKWFNIMGVMAGLIGAVGLIHYSGNGGFVFNINYAIFIILATIFNWPVPGVESFVLVDSSAVEMINPAAMMAGAGSSETYKTRTRRDSA